MPGSDRLTKLLAELEREGITDPRVLAAVQKVPRELFVSEECRSYALRNIPLPIGEGQTISQPFVVALMTQSLGLCGTESVLEVGTGSGYQCAILAELSRTVVSIERFESLTASAQRVLARLGYGNVRLVVGDGSLGHPDLAPYDAIIVTASSPQVPRPLLQQLAEGGRLILPVGSRFSQELILYTRRGREVNSRRLGSVRFVPLVGAAGWKEQEVEAFKDDIW